VGGCRSNRPLLFELSSHIASARISLPVTIFGCSRVSKLLTRIDFVVVISPIHRYAFAKLGDEGSEFSMPDRNDGLESRRYHQNNHENDDSDHKQKLNTCETKIVVLAIHAAFLYFHFRRPFSGIVGPGTAWGKGGPHSVGCDGGNAYNQRKGYGPLLLPAGQNQ